MVWVAPTASTCVLVAETLDVVCFNSCEACVLAPSVLVATVDLCGAAADSVRLTGPFWGWDPNGGPIATDNGDGTWSVTFDPAPNENMEYLWIVDGTQGTSFRPWSTAVLAHQ